jgi:ubiquinone/menaquinone biosynthesis C-methylase UbiE
MFVFDRAAHFYDETRGFPPGEERPIAALIAKAGNFTPSSHILEVGIGTGRIALPLSTHVGSVAGVDLSAGMLNRLIAKKVGENIHLAQADVTRFPFKNGMFDAVIAAHIYHLVPNWIDGWYSVGRLASRPYKSCFPLRTRQRCRRNRFRPAAVKFGDILRC